VKKLLLHGQMIVIKTKDPLQYQYSEPLSGSSLTTALKRLRTNLADLERNPFKPLVASTLLKQMTFRHVFQSSACQPPSESAT